MPEEECILLRGLDAFAELGYDRASARELARRLGVSHNFINDRYGSKAAFWRAAVDFALRAQLARLSLEYASEDDAERLLQIITRLYRDSVDTPLIGRIFVDEFSRDTERLDYLYENYISPAMQTMMPSIERLVASGRMAPTPLDVLFFAIVGPMSGMLEIPLARRLGRPAPASPEQLAATADRLAMLVLSGLLATGSTTGVPLEQ